MPVIVRSHKLLEIRRSTSAIVNLSLTAAGLRSIGKVQVLTVDTTNPPVITLLSGVRGFGKVNIMDAGDLTGLIPNAPSNLAVA